LPAAVSAIILQRLLSWEGIMGVLPVAPGARHQSLDVLRGVAVMGILMVNIPAFFMYWGAYQFPPAHMDAAGANADAWLITITFFEMKFITIFSALFGAGILLMVKDGGPDDLALHRRRMFWLLAFGVIHGAVFWFGDILTLYAIFGLIAVMLRRLSATWLAVWGLAAIALTGLILVGQFYAVGLVPDASAPQEWGMNPDAGTLERFTTAYQSGFLDSRLYNGIGYLIGVLSGLLMFGGRVLGVMLLGMALYKSGFFTLGWSALRYAIAAIPGLLALPLIWMAGAGWIAAGYPMETLWAHAGVNYALSLLAALSWASLVMLVCKAPWLAVLRYPFACAGRMAFTNYLTQTLSMVFLSVGGIGLGWWGTLERSELTMIVVTVWIVQLVVSTLWMQVFRYGPFEWLWRTLSYKSAPPILKRDRPAPATA
jgi:uncharacterized protein